MGKDVGKQVMSKYKRHIVQIEAVGIGLLNWHSAGTCKNCQNPRSAMLSISWVIVMLELYEMKYIDHYLY